MKIHETAQNCPSCGGNQRVYPGVQSINSLNNESSWMAVTSSILGLFSLIVWFDDSGWDKDTYLGVFSSLFPQTSYLAL